MKKILLSLALAGAPTSAAYAAPIPFTGSYTQNFNNDSPTNTLTFTPEDGASNVVPPGVEFVERNADNTANSNIDQTYRIENGGSNAGGVQSYGATNSTERALGELGSAGAPVNIFGFGFTNATGGVITDLNLGYTGEQWRFGGNSLNRPAGTRDFLNFQYSVGATSVNDSGATFIEADAFDFFSPVASGTATPSTNAAPVGIMTFNSSLTNLNIMENQTFFFRFVGNDIGGSDDGLAVDDFFVNNASVAAVPEPSTYALFAIGLGGIAFALRRKKAAEGATAYAAGMGGSGFRPC